MSEEVEERLKVHRDELRAYVETSDMKELCKSLLTASLRERPKDVLAFMLGELQKKQAESGGAMGGVTSKAGSPGSASGKFRERLVPGHPPAYQSSKGGDAFLIIDPQADFHPGGSLAVKNANEDTQRICDLINKNIKSITQINVTLDSHQLMHISHGAFWEGEDGKPPADFTVITQKDFESGKWQPRNKDLMGYCKNFLSTLEKLKQYEHIIWPVHCLTGTPGHRVMDNLQEAMQKWCMESKDSVNYVHKGTNCLTEMYSAFQAAVWVEDDASTHYNFALRDRLLEADRVLICGEALSHCVKESTLDLVAQWPAERLKDLVLIEDCSSAVGGFEKQAKEFVERCRELGLTVMKSSELY